jgi:hypothetical protein
MSTNTLRIATITATGERFAVRGLSRDLETVNLWGPWVAYRGKRFPNGRTFINHITFEPAASVPRASVTMQECERTQEIVLSLPRAKPAARTSPRPSIDLDHADAATIIDLISKMPAAGEEHLLAVMGAAHKFLARPNRPVPSIEQLERNTRALLFGE